MTIKKRKLSEENFEDHFCERLEFHGYQKRKVGNYDFEEYLDFDLIEEFLKNTQPDELKIVIEEYGDRWKKEFIQRFKDARQRNEKIFEILRSGINIASQNLKLLYVKPATKLDKLQLKKYKANIFSYVRQFYFISKDDKSSIDIVLFLNGFPIVTIELKSQFNCQVVDDAVSQYISRDKKYKIFNTPFLHIAADTSRVKIASEFIRDSADDFVHFNKKIKNDIVDGEYRVEYLYNDILKKDSIIEIIEHYLNSFELDLGHRKVKTFFFPRYHQRRTIKNITKDVLKKFSKNKKLDLKYLVQHSAGSGKSFTIAVLQKTLRYLHDSDDQAIFDTILILTDRKNLDKQIKGTIESGESQDGIVVHVGKSSELAKELNKGTKVIISTIQKFSVKKLNDTIKDQKKKNICLIIDEAHRSQGGKMQRNMVGKFEPIEETIQSDITKELTNRKFPNMCFIALTATPSEKTLQLFGKSFDLYGMSQAETEGYILPVSENITTYQTLYKLSKLSGADSEYPPLQVYKKLKNKAYEDDRVITDKVGRILEIFEKKTKDSIKGQSGKAMIVTSSRLAAVKYKLILDKELKTRKMKYKSLVAFTDKVRSKEKSGILEKKDYTEKSMNGKMKEKTIEDEFNRREFRFLIVANKFQTGFNQPLLHTMFLDKSLAGINAVQTISRLNRIFPNKKDTLTVDFTGSYKEIIKAFSKFKDGVFDFEGVKVENLLVLKSEILKYLLFSKKEVDLFISALKDRDQIKADNIFSLIEKNMLRQFDKGRQRAFRSNLNKFSSMFSYIDNLVRLDDSDFRNFYYFVFRLANYLNPDGTGKRLDEELKKVFLKSYKIIEKEKDRVKDPTIGGGKGGAPVYATIEEVIDAINLKYDIALTSKDEASIGSYMEEILDDKEIRQTIEVNLDKDLNQFFETSMKDDLYLKFMEYFLHHNRDQVEMYIAKGLEAHLNKSAFNIIVSRLKEERKSSGLHLLL